MYCRVHGASLSRFATNTAKKFYTPCLNDMLSTLHYHAFIFFRKIGNKWVCKGLLGYEQPG